MIGPNNGAVVNVLSYIPAQYWDGIRDGTITTDLTTYIQNALNSGAGVIEAEQGLYPYSTGLTPINGTIIKGAGRHKTIWKYTGTGTAWTFGTSTTALNKGGGLIDCSIQLGDKTSIAIKLIATDSCILDRIYVEGLATPYDNTRTNIGVDIDGADISAFANEINVKTNHIHESFRITTTGTTQPTAQYFRNCYCQGDSVTDSTSIGFNFVAGTNAGFGSQIEGGYIEACSQGLIIGNNAGPITLIGTAFEIDDAYNDITIGTGVQNCIFFGVDYNRIVDNSAGDNMYVDRRGRIGIGVALSGSISNFPQSININNGIRLTNKAEDGTQDSLIITDGTNVGNTGRIRMQCGAGGAAYGGGLSLHGHNHATRAGDVMAGVSSGSGGRFAVSPQGISGARSADVFYVAPADFTGTLTGVYILDAVAGTAQRVSFGAADSGGAGYKLLRIPN